MQFNIPLLTVSALISSIDGSDRNVNMRILLTSGNAHIKRVTSSSLYIKEYVERIPDKGHRGQPNQLVFDPCKPFPERPATPFGRTLEKWTTFFLSF